MYNIAWYTRDRLLDFYLHISNYLKEKIDDFDSYYVCHYWAEEQRLRSNYNITNAWVLANYIKQNWDRFECSGEKIRELEEKYNDIALVRCLWPDIGELNLSEDYMNKTIIGHFEFWEQFLLRNKIDMLVSEMPSILSNSVAWLICKNYDIKFIAFINVPLPDSRIALITSWDWDYQGIEERFLHSDIDEESELYRKVIEYLNTFKNQTKKFPNVIKDIESSKKNAKISLYLMKKIINPKKFMNRVNILILKRNQLYYIQKPITKLIYEQISLHARAFTHKYFKIFDKDMTGFMNPSIKRKDWITLGRRRSTIPWNSFAIILPKHGNSIQYA